MIIKAIEIRDRNTFVPAVAIKMVAANEAQRYLMARVGFRDGLGVVLMRLNDQKAHSDPYDWGEQERTMPNAHLWLEAHFDEIEDGAVVDVRFVLGEVDSPAESESRERD